VDSNGIVPLGAADRSFQMAFHFRRWLQRELPRHLPEDQFPAEEPLKDLRLPGIRKLPRQIGERWPQADLRRLSANGGLGQLPIDHAVAPVVTTGGHVAARTRLRDFVGRKLDQYEDDRNAPDTDGSSGLSPYLHFGHIGAHEVFRAVVAGQDWSPSLVSAKVTGKAKGWWGLRPAAESFLDELITWRELGYIHCRQHHNFDRYDSLPEWSRKTLEKHSNDPRPHVYSLAQLEAAQTHDPLWNAAQRQLLTEGRIHNYMRMLWGKKILEWSESPQEALEVLIELNNKYALDGRDPNSYSGIFWTLGRYDRPWGPERPIFGTVRYMSSESTRRKLDVQGYLNRYSVQFQ
jgi:deoxyribodipyrimidine photo-lyase